MRDTELHQALLGLSAPWEVTAVTITKAAADRPLGEVAVAVRWRPEVPLACPGCGQTGPGYDARARRWRHLNTMQWKTFITAEVPRINCPKCGVKQVRVAWAEDASRFAELFEAFTIQVLKAVRSKVQAQDRTDLSWEAAALQAAIVHDKFHCAKELNRAVDLARRREHRELKREGVRGSGLRAGPYPDCSPATR